MAYFLAIDAGGTKTEFLLADERRELARARSGTIKRLRASEEITSRSLSEGLEQIARQSGIALSSINSTCVGTSGATVPLVADWMLAALHASVGGEILLVGDVEIALDAAFRGGTGVLVLAGTGSNVAGRTTGGEIFTAGGWGPALADQGSGHFIGFEGLRRGYLAIDQQRSSILLPALMKLWKTAEIEDMMQIANANPAPIFSELAPVVVECAKQGDAVATEVLQQGGRDLASLAMLVIERIRAVDGAGALPAVAVAGSILREVAILRDAMEQTLRSTYPAIEVLADAADPIQGALWRAKRGH